MRYLPVLVALGIAAAALGGSPCELAKLLAGDGASGDDFGASVAVDGDVAVVGAPEDDDDGSSSGAAYVFRFDGAQWVQEQKLTAADASAFDDYGFAVAISGDTIVIGAPRDDTAAGDAAGSAYVYTFDGETWGGGFHLFASDAQADDRFGHSVAIDGETILVGAIQEDETATNAGAGYVFVLDGMTWPQQAKLTAASPSGTNPQMGHSASLSGDVAVLGAWQDAPGGMFSVGAVHVFRRAGTAWTEEQKLTASDAADFRWFGQSVSVSGSVIAVGAYGDQAGGLSESGGIYLFEFDGLEWSELENLNAGDAESDDRFGWSVALDGERAVVGTGISASKAYLFGNFFGGWQEAATLNSDDPDVSAEYGFSVDLSGSLAVVGDRNGASGNGVAFVFDVSGSCPNCPWDLDGCGEVGITDFLILLANWGNPYGIKDFLALLADWGPCP